MTYKVGYYNPAGEDVVAVIRQALPANCDLVTLPAGADPVERTRDLDFLIAGKVTRAMMEAAPRLKLIMTPGVGYDGIDLEAAAERDLPVAVTVCGNTDEVAEFALLLMLAVSRRLTELDAGLKQGRWMMWDRRLQSRNLKGKTLGLLGYGRIGQAVASRAKGFEMNVQFYDPQCSVSIPMDELLRSSDYVSLHLPLTPATRNSIDAGTIAKMKYGAILINTARGEVVDEGALLEALLSGKLAGAGLDVFQKEPVPSDNPLLQLPNVVVSPHIASGTFDGLQIKAAQYAENIRRRLAGQDIIDLLPSAVAGARS